MLHEHMQVHDGDKRFELVTDVSGSEPLTMAFQFWMAEVARDMLRLGVYFRAVAIMLQIPGAAEYQWVEDEGENENETPNLIAGSGQNTLRNVLAECLERLGAKPLMEQVAGADYEAEELSDEWRAVLDKREKVKNGLLTVVAECLDKLVVRPGMEEIGQADEPHWWQRFRVETH